MSVGFAFIAKNEAYVATDSHRESESGDISFTNKTFKTTKPPTIGAHSGLLEFSGKSTLEHILEIIEKTSKLNITEIASFLASELSEGLKTSEYARGNQSISILLVGKVTDILRTYSIKVINIVMDNGDVNSNIESFTGSGACAVIGDMCAKNAILYKTNNRKCFYADKNKDLVRIFIKEMIEFGIKNCSNSCRHPKNKTCGGNVNMQIMS